MCGTLSALSFYYYSAPTLSRAVYSGSSWPVPGPLTHLRGNREHPHIALPSSCRATVQKSCLGGCLTPQL